MSNSQTKPFVPARDEEQMKEALALANEIRSARHQVKEQLKRRELDLACLITDFPPSGKGEGVRTSARSSWLRAGTGE